MQSIFVSSTFKDMQGERDTLHRLVMPRLREMARKYTETVQFVDLRWGISTTDMDSDEGAGKILEVCLEEIRQCRPYMIVLLGQRYGWMPSPALLQGTAAEKDFPLESYEMSVTELEIRYGVYLASGQLERCIFCLRDDLPLEQMSEEMRGIYQAGDAADADRMRQLRERICNTPGARVLRYSLDWDSEKQDLTGYDRFADDLTKKLENILLPTWKQRQSMNWQQRQREEDRLVIGMHQSTFVGRERELKELTQQIDAHRVVILEGEGGCGKSALMAQLLKRYQQHGIRAEMFCCGNSSRCMSVAQLVTLLSWLLAGQTDDAAPGVSGDVSYWQYYRLVENYSGPPMVLFIDAIDQLTPDYALYRSKFIPPKIPRQLTLVISTTGSVQVDPMALPTGSRGTTSKRIKLTPPDQEELRQILHARFLAEHKQVSNQVADKLLQNPCSQNMLGMELMVRRLVMLGKEDFEKIAEMEKTMDGDTAITAYLTDLAEHFEENLFQLINQYLDQVCAFLDKENSNSIKAHLYLVSLLQHGVSMEQLDVLFKNVEKLPGLAGVREQLAWVNTWDSVRFARLRRYMGNLLMYRSDGRMDFSHRLMREAMCNRPNVNNLAVVLMMWVLKMPQEEDTRLENALVLLRRYYDSLRSGPNPEPLHPDVIDLLDDVIWKADKLTRSEKLEEKAEGNRQMDVLIRSILGDLRGVDRGRRLDSYCDILDIIISDRAGGAYNWVWFFANDVTKHLAQQEQQDWAMALQILCRVITSMQKQRAAYEAGEEKFAKNWRLPGKRILLSFCQRAMALFVRLRQGRSLGRVRLYQTYGQTVESIFDIGAALAEECLEDTEKAHLIHYRKAMLNVHAISGQIDTKLDTRKLLRHVDVALESAGRMMVLVSDLPDKTRLTYVSGYVYILAGCINAFLDVKKTLIFSGKKIMTRCGNLCAEAWEVLNRPENEDRLEVADTAAFLLSWNRYMVTCADGLFAKTEDLRSEIIEKLWKFYYVIRKNEAWPLTPKERKLMANLAAEIGRHLLYGKIPENIKGQGYTVRTAKGFLVEKESGYLQSQADNSFEDRWYWAMMLCTEASYYDGWIGEKAVRTARNAETVMTELIKEAKKGSWIMQDVFMMEKLVDLAQRIADSNEKK